jgi:hypothetical protein
MRDTEDVNKAVTALTLRNVRSAFVKQLEALAAGGRDVSGYTGIYQDMNEKINQLESEINLSSGTPQDFSTEFASFNTAQSTDQAGDGVLKAVGKFFFGE